MTPQAQRALGDGRYRIERRLGTGGMASVWLASDTRLDRPVAVKLIADALAHDGQWVARFRREAQAAASISHPSVVSVFDYGVEDGRPYMVMEYVSGPNLAQRLADPAAGSPRPEVLARELLEAVGCVHDAGIVHRDITAANILLGPTGRAHLADFGIARPDDAASLTQTGVVIGTQRYLAPEVAAGQPATRASDLYSTGIVLREVAGDRPTPAMEGVIRALTAPAPDRRPASAAAALRRLAPATSAPTAAATQVRRPAGPAPRRRPRLLAGLGAALLVAVALAVILAATDTPGRRATSARTAAPAAPEAPLAEQLRALDRLVDDARP